jgi:RNA polymerase sigma-70 factor (TIGR02943 family)
MSSEPSITSHDVLADSERWEPDQWVDRYGDYLYRFALLRLRNTSEAEEAVQETFLAAIIRLDQFAGSGSQRAWLLGILRRKVLDAMRQRARHKNTVLRVNFDPTRLLFDETGKLKSGALPTIAPDVSLESQELWGKVRECLQQIAPAQADVFVLSVIEEMTPENICQELDISMSNFWVRLHRARLGLAKCVAAKWFHHDEEVPPL